MSYFKMHYHFLVYLIFCPLFLDALTLQKALKDLHINNTDLQISQQQIKKSQYKKDQKFYGQFGSIDGFGSITKYNEKRTLAPLAPPIAPNVPTDDTLKNIGISYSVTLFNGFKESSQIELSNLVTNMEQTKHKLTLSQLEFNVQSLFCDISSLQKNLEASKEYKKALEKIYEFTHQEYDLGKKSQLELLKIEADLATSNNDITELQTKIDILKHSLSILIYGSFVEFKIDESELETKIEKFTLENLPQIKLAKLSSHSKEKLLTSINSSYYPKVVFNSSYSDVYGDGQKENIITVSLNFAWKLYDFGAREAQVQEAKIELLQAKLEEQKTKEQMSQTIFEAQKNIQKNQQLLESSQANLEVMKKTKQIEEILYKQGQKDISDYLLSLALYTKSVAKNIQAKYTLLKSKYYFNAIVKE